ncbi:hypothetical protein SAMN06264849_103111 [Melghirimyces algeriensis]|uniref:Uncharacterized protein n=1 Tax=Melghirimyces algeriensis TaxID=910412 RepID=A0A521C436_9BACL|nr:hypothetical protein SAMN06264849_103111 [Melghirimyces algeriensis]
MLLPVVRVALDTQENEWTMNGHAYTQRSPQKDDRGIWVFIISSPINR